MQLRVFFAIIVFGLATPAAADGFDNESVVVLTKAGVGDDVILTKIDSLPCGYDVSTDGLIALKSAGVSNEVISAMVARCVGAARAQGAVADNSNPLVMRTPGIYIDMGTSGAHNLQAVKPINGVGAKISGNGSLIFPYTAKLAIARENAQIKANAAQPSFYFYFPADDGRIGDFGTSASLSAQSPNEFSLVKFKAKSGQREMVVGKATMFNANVGIDPKGTIKFDVEEVGDGIYRLSPSTPLEPGEYAFVLRAGSDTYRIYDFRF